MKRNAIILAAGCSSRFFPLSQEYPKGLLCVRGEILIERQIRQLIEADITDITVVVGYKAEMFQYLEAKYNVSIILNEDYYRYNNSSSLIRVLDKLGNTFICSCDNYFPKNVFLTDYDFSYYSALFARGSTNEYCITFDDEDKITGVSIGGSNSWYMIGPVYFKQDFSNAFSKIIRDVYNKEETKNGYWEDVYIKYINELPKMKINRYDEGEIEEFDSLDELRLFDKSYVNDTRSKIIKHICSKMGWKECELNNFIGIKRDDAELCMTFKNGDVRYIYKEKTDKVFQI